MSTVATPEMLKVPAMVVFERKQYERAAAGSVIRAKEWKQMEEMDAMLQRLNGLYDKAAEELEQARAQARQTGFAEGVNSAQQQMAEQLAALNERRARALSEASSRVAELACAIVSRIAPSFDPSKVVPPLVSQAVEAAQAEQFLVIRVHPSVRDQVAANIGAVRQAHPAVGVIELMDDEGLDPLSCVVVSEAGEVRAGVAQQIEAIRTALAGANAAIGAG